MKAEYKGENQKEERENIGVGGANEDQKLF
jgi:hypothetical protein